MNGLIKAWQALPLQNKIVSVLAVAATVILFSFFFRQVTKPDLALLYSGLDPAAAGEVVTELQNRGIPYEVRGETIYADAKQRDTLRVQLAEQGLPRKNTTGYELLDDLNSFAMTSEMFNTAYWRAKEGELARTLLAMPGVRAARVHIGATKRSSFNRTQSAASASVTVTTVSGLDKRQATAIQHMTALAVAGLAPKDVVVVDAAFGVVAGPGQGNESGSLGTSGELDKAAEIENGLLSLLHAHVGFGNARVEVAVEMDRERQVVSERVIDPNTRVITSRTTSEVTESANGTTANVTVASNLPEGEAGAGNSTNSDRSETTEQEQYDMSELRRDTEKMPGTVTRMTIAVLLNDAVQTTADGTVTTTPRSAEELETLKELVTAAAGIDEARGDVLTIKSLPFTAIEETVATQGPTLLERFLENYLWNTIQALILGTVVLVLGLFVIKPLLTQKTGSAAAPLALPGAESGGVTSTTAVAADGQPVQTLQPHEDPIETLKALAAEKPDDAASLLVSWLEQDERVAS